jgi:uncharacterized membrane protein SpoIIM required for sporulation
VHLELAGVGSRTAAALVDTALGTLGLVLLAWILSLSSGVGVGERLTGWVAAVVILVFTFGVLAYFVLFEALNGGRTPGKQLIGIRVVMETGHSVAPTAAVIRNLLRLIDCYFPLCPFLPGLVMIFLHGRNQRLGDLAAGTIVVRDRPTEWRLGPVAAPPDEPFDAGPPALSDDEFRLLDQFLARAHALDPLIQTRFATELARRFQAHAPRPVADPGAYLTVLHGDEQRKRRSRFATRARAGTVGRTTVTAERFVERKREAWERFYDLANRIERSGVAGLGASEIPEFAARYREVAADLARAHTYGVGPQVIEYLERVVSAGHNALYRARGRRRAPVFRYVVRDFPAAVVQSRGYVGAAALLFAVPAAIGYGIVRTQPERIDELVPPVMVSRAEQAAERQAQGLGYAESREEDLPVIASAIISNNVRIAFWAFVGGVLLGLPTVWVLVTNGLSLGAGFGLFVNYHAGGYLGRFVAGHGFLELTAIFIAGGAAFRIAGALLVPGDRTRRDALVLEGRIAARMIGAVVTLLAVAGTIEGLLSASDAPAALKYVVSALSLVLLGVYFGSGWAEVRRAAREPAPTPPEPRTQAAG